MDKCYHIVASNNYSEVQTDDLQVQTDGKTLNDSFSHCQFPKQFSSNFIKFEN